MSDTYLIRGTISIQVQSGKSMHWVTPCAGFLTPDKKKAIAFPYRSRSTKAKLIKLTDRKTFACKTKKVMKYLPDINALVAQGKTIELSLNVSKPKKIKVTGFTFPAPTDHAHGC